MPSDSPGWHYSIDARTAGPVSSENLRLLAQRGELRPTDIVWKAGMSDWVSASKIPGLFPAPASLGSAPAAAPPKLPSTMQETVTGSRKPMGLLVWALIAWTPLLVLTAVAARQPSASDGVFVLSLIIVISTGIWAAVDSARLGFRNYKSDVSSRPWVLGLCVLVLWAAVFPLYLSERARLKAGLIPAKDGKAAGGQISWLRGVALLGMLGLFNILAAVLALAGASAQPSAGLNSSDRRQQEQRVSPSGAWTASIVRAASSGSGVSDAEKIGLVASMPESAECSAKFWAALVMIQASNSDRGEDFKRAQAHLHEAVDQSCSLAQAGDALLKATDDIRDARLPDAAAALQSCVPLLRAAADESATKQVEDPQMKATAALSLGLGCYQVCELYMLAEFDPALAPATCSAFELMEELVSSGHIAADPTAYGTASRAAAAAYVSQIGSSNHANDVDLAARARAALQIEWTPGSSLSVATVLIAETSTWAQLGEAGKARAALNQAIKIMDASGRDVAQLRALAASEDREFLKSMTE
jgi:hypothetical protein